MKHRIRPEFLFSWVCCALCLVADVAFAIMMPSEVHRYVSKHEPTLLDDLPFIITCLYIGVAIAAVVLILLFLLLNIIRKHAVFSTASGRLISVIAWFVILEGCVFGALTAVYLPAIGIPFVAVTLGLCLLVVSNVLKEAAAIKAENDQTI